MQVLFEEVITVVGTEVDADGTVPLLNVEEEVVEETIMFPSSFVMALSVLLTLLGSILAWKVRERERGLLLRIVVQLKASKVQCGTFERLVG